MKHRNATIDDLDTLARLNLELVQDEGHRHRKKPLQWIKERMEALLQGGYKAVIFEKGPEIAAYALYRETEDEVHLRHFFVSRGKRRQGLGAEACRILKDEIWPRRKRLTVGVLVSNTEAHEFWKSFGFRDYAIELEIPPRE